VKEVPLAVDLDGTLVRTDTLWESVAALVRRDPLAALALPFWLLRGKASFKSEIARRVEIDVSLLPYDAGVLRELRHQRSEGRWIVLATASDSRIAERVAAHLGLFDAVLASDGVNNLKREAKAQALVERYGEGRFDYMGEDRHDVPVWKHAGTAYVVGAEGIAAEIESSGKPVQRVPREGKGWWPLARAMRVYQWAKNLLVFVPLATAHLLLNADAIEGAVLAFAAFCLTASAVYLLNDLSDLQDDRRHPTKRSRPLAAGDVSLGTAAMLVPLLLAASAAIAWFLPPAFGALLLLYLATNLAYSLRVKRIAIVDVFVLAALYTLRILAGAAAIAVPVSHWLLAFSLFAFLSLALVKRFVEVSNVASRDEVAVAGRGYVASDGQLLAMLGTASAGLAVLVFALYITSPQVAALYRSPAILWFAVPLLFYWLSRVWFLAHRGALHEDPLLFAMHDPASYATGLAIFVAMLAAT